MAGRKVLALGAKTSAAYRSISQALVHFLLVEFVSEHRFVDPSDCATYLMGRRFDAALMPNPYGNEVRRRIYDYLRDIDFPVIVFDRGGLPNSWFFDWGFNADSQSYSRERWDKALTLEQTSRVHEYLRSLKDMPPLEAQGKLLGVEGLRERLGVGTKKILFVSLQRPSDTTTRFFCKPMPSLDAFHSLVGALARELPKALPDWTIVAKKHPLETMAPPLPVTFANDAHIHDLLDACDAVLTLNSGTGLLAACWAKPVLLGGTAYYSDARINRKVSSVEDVVAALKSHLKVDVQTRDRFVHHLITSVYSFGRLETGIVSQSDGTKRNVTRNIDFESIRLPRTEPCKVRKLLFVTSVIPYPFDRGSAHRTDQMLRALLELDFEIDLLCLNQSEPNSSQADIRRRLQVRYPGLKHIDVVPHPGLATKAWTLDGARYGLLRLGERLYGRDNRINSIRYLPPDFEAMIRARLDSARYELAWFNYLRVMPSNLQTRARKVCDLHDYQTKRIEEDVMPKLPSWRRKKHLRRFRQSECDALQECDLAISISPVEMEEHFSKKIDRDRLICIPATDDPKAIIDIEENIDLLFVGSRSDANARGLIWFLSECWPKIVGEVPSVSLRIQGSITFLPQITNGRWLKRDNITFSPPVEDLGPIYRSAKVVICPILDGTGMKIKVIEAMSYGRAIVGTSKALEGVNLSNVIQRYDGALVFSEACIKALRSISCLEELKLASFKTFHAYHKIDNAIGSLRQVLCSGCKW